MEQFSRNRIWWQDYDAIRMLNFLDEIAQQMQDNGATNKRPFEFEHPTGPLRRPIEVSVSSTAEARDRGRPVHSLDIHRFAAPIESLRVWSASLSNPS